MHDLIVKNARLYPMSADASVADATSFAVDDGLISELDPTGTAREIVDARGRVVLPGLVDCHTHALYAGDRMREHTLRLQGTSYEEIARAGGGIRATVAAVREASEQELVRQTMKRVDALQREGVTAIEIKSGYGLSTEAELKMLRAIRSVGDESGLHITATFLGAHAVPKGTSKQAYLSEVIDTMLPAIAAEQLASMVDIYVESIAFDIQDMRRLFDRAREMGFSLRAHTEQLSNMHGSAAAASLGASSCDHLEHLDEQGVRIMAESGSVAVLLPGAYYFLRDTKKPPVELLRRHGVPMAVATDLNPGTSPVVSLLSAMHMSATMFGLTPDEVLLGVTRHAARVVGRESTVGSLESGKSADFSVWSIPEPDFLTYQLGGVYPDAVYIRGTRQ